MGDILSQDEVDALLSATDVQLELVAQLRKEGLDNRQLARVVQRINELARTDMPEAEVVAQVYDTGRRGAR
jgi:flagellar motor switch protein FliM